MIKSICDTCTDFWLSEPGLWVAILGALGAMLTSVYLILCIVSDWYLERIGWNWPLGAELERAPLDLVQLWRERRRVPRVVVVGRNIGGRGES